MSDGRNGGRRVNVPSTVKTLWAVLRFPPPSPSLNPILPPTLITPPIKLIPALPLLLPPLAWLHQRWQSWGSLLG